MGKLFCNNRISSSSQAVNNRVNCLDNFLNNNSVAVNNFCVLSCTCARCERYCYECCECKYQLFHFTFTF